MTRIVISTRSKWIWVFTSSRFFVSRDGGQNFVVAGSASGLVTKPVNLTGYNATPEALVVDDSTWINLNLDRPGLFQFARDTLQKNLGVGDLEDALLDKLDGLDISRGQGRLTQGVVVQKGARRFIAFGSNMRGLFYRELGNGKDWKNVTRQRSVESGLTEIITFPTLFTAATLDGAPDYVNIGYRLKKDGKVTITVFNYAMEKVRDIVKQAPRKGGQSRSENPLEDRWDGRDQSGRAVSPGTYYIRVQSSQGEGGWGKALAVAGRQ